MRHAVIFSSFVPDTEVADAVGNYYIDIIGRYFSDSTIYVGINKGSSQNWRVMLARSGLDIVVCDVPDHLVVSSDVAGFQAILRTLRYTRAAHDFYWFGHTKGASHEKFSHAEGLRALMERDFWSRRAEIEAHCDPVRHGTFAALPMPVSSRGDNVLAYLRSIFPALYPPLGMFPTHTFFGMTGAALRNFLASAHERFFTHNLLHETGQSRYFFECGFSWVADMGGFEPYLLRPDVAMQAEFVPVGHPALRGPCHPNAFALNRQKVSGLLDAWCVNPSEYDFSGWPGWAGEGRVEYQGRTYDMVEFYQLHPGYAP